MDATVKSGEGESNIAIMEGTPTETLSKIPFKCVIPEETFVDDEYIPWTQLTVDYQLDEDIFECQSYTFNL